MRRLAVARWWAGAAAMWAMVVGLLVLAGWAFDIAVLKSVRVGDETMKANTALGFVLAGASLWLVRDLNPSASRRQWARACAACVTVIGSVTLAEVAFDWQLHFGDLIFAEALPAAGTRVAGRMSPSSAVGLSALGLALLLTRRRGRGRVWSTLSHIVIGLGAFSVIGYVYDMTALYRLPTFSAMALDTAGTFVVLGSGVLCVRPDRGMVAIATSSSLGGWTARRLTPVALFAPLFLGWLIHKAGVRQSGFEWRVMLLALANSAAIGLVVWWSARSLHTSDLDRERGAQALERAREELLRAVAAGQVGLWDWDLVTNHVEFSSEWKRMIGYRDHEITGHFDELRSRVHPDDLPRVVEHVQAYLSGATPVYEVEFQFRHKDGSYRYILARGSKILDAEGTAARLVGSHVDITERWLLQGQFLQAQKMESIGLLAGGVAHDFNNLLTVINGTADLAIEDLGNRAALQASLQEIRRAGERAALLTGQLLAFSRRQVMKPEVLDLTAVVAATRGMLQRLIGENVVLTLKLAETAGHVKADPGQIDQVILNLAVNAVDAMPRGGTLTLETRAVARAEADGEQAADPEPQVLLAVSDTGVGMDEATIARIFEPFFTTKAEGTGLGLSTVYGIVKQSGGTVVVYSELGAGTTFEIRLPQVADAVTAPRGLAPSARGVANTETVLVVEDELAVRTLVARLLRQEGYTVVEAGDGEEALARFTAHFGRVQLVVTDVVLPGLDGRRLSEQLTAVDPSVKVLYMSGYTNDAVLRHGVFDETAHFIAKPFTRTTLAAAVRGVLDSFELTPAPGGRGDRSGSAH